jgi:hypothetical protein
MTRGSPRRTAPEWILRGQTTATEGDDDDWYYYHQIDRVSVRERNQSVRSLVEARRGHGR